MATPGSRDVKASRAKQAARMTGLVEEAWSPQVLDEMFRRAGTASPEEFRHALHCRFANRGRFVLTGSARAALTGILEALHAKSARPTVLLSSFNCDVVPGAVRKAGLAYETFDFSSSRGAFDWERIGARLRSDHLAVVVPHFFGIPTDFRPLIEPARRAGVRIIEDCAHCLGGSIGDVQAGQLGDAAVFSFNYDKPISLAGGGALLVNDDSIAAPEMGTGPSPADEYWQFRRLVGFLDYSRTRRGRPTLAARVGARLRLAPYAPPRLPGSIGSFRAAVGLWQLERYDLVREARNRNAALLRGPLAAVCWDVADSVTPAWLKHRVVVARESGEAAIRHCAEEGIYVGNANWAEPIDRDGTASNPNAHLAAAFGLDVPVHQNLSNDQLAAIARAFAGAHPAQLA